MYELSHAVVASKNKEFVPHYLRHDVREWKDINILTTLTIIRWMHGKLNRYDRIFRVIKEYEESKNE